MRIFIAIPGKLFLRTGRVARSTLHATVKSEKQDKAQQSSTLPAAWAMDLRPGECCHGFSQLPQVMILK
jgi:hypothetical protein